MTLPGDVRWDGEASVVVADARAGLQRWSFDAPEELSSVAEPTWRSLRFPRPAQLGLSSSHVAWGGVAFLLRWAEREGHASALDGEYAVEFISDLDVFRDRLLVAGIRRDEEGRLASGGAIGFTARLGEELVPLVPTLAGPGAKPFEACAPLDLAKVRFLPDGSALVLPGAEPGVFLYGPDLRLKRTWDTSAFPIDVGCELDEEQALRFGTDPAARLAWMNRRRLVDEILPLPGGAGLVVRERTPAGLTRWELAFLSRDGEVSWHDLPVSSTSPGAVLEGDARDGEIVLLIETDGGWSGEPDGPPRLVRLVWTEP